jgi:hypothetical protein
MNKYTTQTTPDGQKTFLLEGDATAAIFVAEDHEEAAALAAELLNDVLDAAFAPTADADELVQQEALVGG